MRLALPFTLFATSAPAWAASAAVPEPSATALFALGVLGVIVGRRGARKDRD